MRNCLFQILYANGESIQWIGYNTPDNMEIFWEMKELSEVALDNIKFI